MRKIAFYSTLAGAWGGSEELWSRSALFLTDHGVIVDVGVAPIFSPEKQSLLQTHGCRLWKLPPFRRPQRVFRRQKFNWLDRANPDMVVLSLAVHHHGAEWMAELQDRKIPYVLIVQSADESYFHSDENVPALRAGYERARQCFFVSQANKEFVQWNLAAEFPEASIVRNPFKVSYDAAPTYPQEKNGRFQIACVARLEPIAKGQDILFSVINRAKWRARSLSVTLFGNGLTQQTLEHAKEVYKLDNVDFGGFVENVESIWKLHQALILPSRFEGLPLALVEAMLCRRCAIVTDVSGNAELIEDNVTGFVAAGPSARALDEALERAWLRREEWMQIGMLAGSRVRDLVPPDPGGLFGSMLLDLML